ncbi:MAG: hypothetical protein ACK55I_28860, partial [bacterium]
IISTTVVRNSTSMRSIILTRGCMSEFALSGMYLEKARELLTVKNDLIRDTNDDTNFSDVMIGTKKTFYNSNR